MRKILLLFSLLLSISISISAQIQLTDDTEISVLTIGPGANLNDAFGHSAFRVKSSRYDYIFNYGVFDFNDPNFYTDFAQGKLNYWLGVTNYDNFYRNYVAQDRWIKEQILNLSNTENQDLIDFLIDNARPENKFYLYDFFFDNCATKIKDVLIPITNGINFNTPLNFEPKSFRKLIHDHVSRNSWGSLGIDVALGSIIDKIATPEEHMFLPIYIYDFFASAQKQDGTALVKSESLLYQNTSNHQSHKFLWSPLMLLGLLGLFIMYLTYNDFRKQKRSKWLDCALFVSTGLIGIVLLVLWFATDHTATAFNYNLLWAFALNILVFRQTLSTKPKSWFRKYIKLLIILLCLLTLHWSIGVQVFAIGLIPLLMALGIRYVYLIYHLKG